MLDLRCFVKGFSGFGVSGCYSPLQCLGFSSQWLLLLPSAGSGVHRLRGCSTQTLEHAGSVITANVPWGHGLSSCGVQVLLLRGMRNLPRPGIEPTSPALADTSLSTVPPGKSPCLLFFSFFFSLDVAAFIVYLSFKYPLFAAYISGKHLVMARFWFNSNKVILFCP